MTPLQRNEIPALEEAYEAAEIDGAGIWHKLTKITLPSILRCGSA